MREQDNSAPARTFAERREFERKLLADAQNTIQVMCMADGASPTAGILSLLRKALVAAHDREDAALAIPYADPTREYQCSPEEEVWERGHDEALDKARKALGFAEVSA